MKKAVLFDVDGTLLDTADFIFGAFKHTLVTHGHSIPADKLIKKAMGKPLLKFYKTFFPKSDPKIYAQTHIDYQAERFYLSKPFPKIRKLLKKLKDSEFLIAAVSNRTRDSLIRSLKQAKIFEYFDLVISAEDVVNPKPHKEHINVVLKKLKVKPQNAYIVGDMDHDILAGKNAGIKTVGVTYGFLGQEVKKYHPDYLIDSIEELQQVLK